MKIDLRANFDDRLEEVDAYLDFLIKIEKWHIEGDRREVKKLVTVRQQRILYSNFYLQLYSLVESTVNFCVDSLGKEILEKECIPYQLNKCIRKEWVRASALTDSGLSKDKRLIKTYELCHTFLEKIKEFEIDLGAGGNWDDLKMKQLSDRLGMRLEIDKEKYKAMKTQGRDGDSSMVSVRKLRNKLSHGSISFSDCAESIVFSDLCRIRDAVVGYLEGFIVSFEKYIFSDAFLDSETHSVIKKSSL